MFVAIVGCTDFVDTIPEYKIQSDTKIFVDRFFKEGSARGVILKQENLIVIVTDNVGTTLLPKNSSGYSVTIGNQRYITIWSGAYYYFLNKGQPEAAERLLFHELGHAFGREHNNNPMSIMCQCMANEIYVNDDTLRSILLDELFDRQLISY